MLITIIRILLKNNERIVLRNEDKIFIIADPIIKFMLIKKQSSKTDILGVVI